MTEASNISPSLEVSKGLVGKMVMALLGFAGTIIFARVLGASRFGSYYLLLMIAEMLKKPVDGWSVAAKKRYSESLSPKSEILAIQILLPVILVAVIAVLAYVLRSVVVDYTGISRSYQLLIFLVGSLSIYSSFESILSASGRIGRQTGIDTFRSLLTLGLQALFVWYGTGALGMAYGLGLATLLSVPLFLWSIDLTVDVPNRDTVYSLWRFAKDSIPYVFVSKAWDRYDIFLIGLLLSPAIVGYYEVAYKLVIPATFLSGMIGSVMMPRTSNLQSKGEDVTADIANALSFASVFAIPIFFGALAISEKLVVTAYSGEFRPASTLLIGLALYQVFNSQSTVFGDILAGLDHHHMNLRISVVAFVMNVLLGYLLLLEYGALGVVIATVVASVIEYSAGAYLLRSYGLPSISRTVLYEIVAGIFMYACVVFLSGFVEVKSWFTLLLVVGSGGAIYFLLLIVLSVRIRTVARSVFEKAV